MTRVAWVILTSVVLLAVLGIGKWGYERYWWPTSPPGADMLTALQCGDGRRVRTLLRSDPSRINAGLVDSGVMPLHVAAARGDNRMVRLLLASGAEVNQEPRGRRMTVEELRGYRPHDAVQLRGSGRPLDMAYANRHLDTALLLLRHGADPTLSLVDAVAAADLERTRFLVAHGADASRPIAIAAPVIKGMPSRAVVYATGDLPIHIAVQTGNPELAEYLLGHGSPVNAAGAMGRTPMHTVALFGALPMVRLLLAHGADCTLRNAAGQTPFDVATEALVQTQWVDANCPAVVRAEKSAGIYIPASDYQQIVSLLRQPPSRVKR